MLYGQRAEAAFTRSWGVGLGIEQAVQFKDVIEDSGRLFLTLLFMQLLLVSPGRWWEQHLDALSVQGTLLQQGATTFRQRMGTHLTFFASNRKKA